MIRSVLVVILALAGVTAAAQEQCDDFDVAADLACIRSELTGEVRTQLQPRCPERVLVIGSDDGPYSSLAAVHRLDGNACYYSSFFHGRKTANGEIFRNDRYSAAHLTLPLGTKVEVESLATGKKIELRVNDRGPYKGNFIIDLSQAAARAIGVDKARDRRVKVRVLALPGDEGE